MIGVAGIVQFFDSSNIINLTSFIRLEDRFLAWQLTLVALPCWCARPSFSWWSSWLLLAMVYRLVSFVVGNLLGSLI